VQIVESVAGKPVLTVGDSQGFAERGVLINLFEDRGYLRFDINTAAVQASPLKFSSRLLRLGRAAAALSRLSGIRRPGPGGG
jgi:hypothetical protein